MIKIKDKEKILKAARTYKGTTIRRIADFSVETLKAKKKWYDIFKVMKAKKCTTKNTLTSKVLIKELMETTKALWTSETKRVQHYKTSFTTNVKGNSLANKKRQLEKRIL